MRIELILAPFVSAMSDFSCIASLNRHTCGYTVLGSVAFGDGVGKKP